MLSGKVPSGRQDISPPSFRPSPTGLYDPKAFITHAASLRQGFPHCAIFPTAASRRSLECLSSSVADHPLRPATRRSLGRPLPHQQADGPRAPPLSRASKERPHITTNPEGSAVLRGISPGFPRLSPVQRIDYPRVTHPCAALLSPRRGCSRTTCMC